MNYHSPNKIFRSFAGLFVLFGSSFYIAKRIVNSRRTSELEDYRAQQPEPAREHTKDQA
ncbi:hypothetical protein R3P38DRAFT_175860 [Favolaschia claudopus]|uniref:Uncharacterized protein n=1 Tax=Favolaschia claudopus TaxID=2862362 RepID=A0AAW0D096_9AGAR